MQNRLASYIALIFSLLLTSCGGGGDTPPNTPIVYEALPITADTVTAAVNIWTGDQNFAITPSCGSDPTISCPGGLPSSPAPQIALTYASTTVPQSASLTSYTFSSLVSLVSVTDIPVNSSLVGNCILHINTNNAGGLLSTVQIAGTATFDSHNQTGTIDRLQANNLTMTGLEGTDITITGIGCTLSNLGGTSFVSGIILNSLSTQIANHSLCGAPGAPLFTACP